MRPLTLTLSQWERVQKGPVTSSAAARSPPLVNRDSLLIITAHNAPVPVGLAAHYHDVDVLATKHRNQLLRQGLELRGPRFLSERGAGVNVVLDELIVPVFAGRQAGVVVEPIDEFLLA